MARALDPDVARPLLGVALVGIVIAFSAERYSGAWYVGQVLTGGSFLTGAILELLAKRRANARKQKP